MYFFPCVRNREARFYDIGLPSDFSMITNSPKDNNTEKDKDETMSVIESLITLDVTTDQIISFFFDNVVKYDTLLYDQANAAKVIMSDIIAKFSTDDDDDICNRSPRKIVQHKQQFNVYLNILSYIIVEYRDTLTHC